MNPLMAQAISVAVLLALWDGVCGMLTLSIYPAIIAWGCFYAAGGKTEGIAKTIAALLSGAFWGVLATWASANLGGRPVGVIAMGLAGLAIVLQTRVALLSFLGGAIIGLGTLVSFPNLLAGSLLRFCGSLIAGVLLGWLSEMLAGKLKKA